MGVPRGRGRDVGLLSVVKRTAETERPDDSEEGSGRRAPKQQNSGQRQENTRTTEQRAATESQPNNSTAGSGRGAPEQQHRGQRQRRTRTTAQPATTEAHPSNSTAGSGRSKPKTTASRKDALSWGRKAEPAKILT